jgi:ankyrin repeat protein
MRVNRKYIICLAIIALACHFEMAYSQDEPVTAIDTSAYLDRYYENYKDFNLLIAASLGYTSEIEKFVSIGSDINFADNEGVTPLMTAVINNKPETVKEILKFNPTLDKLTLMSETPLLYAAKNNYFEIAEDLLKAGADVDYPDRNGATPLHYAALNGYFEMSDLLLYYGALVDEKSDDGATPLMASIMAGYANVADLLIQNGANMEARNNDGFTPFLLAAVNGDTLVMDILRKQGVDIYTVNKAKYNALDLTISSNAPEATRYLLRVGDKWGSEVKSAVSPYQIAEKYRRREVLSMLRESKIPGQIRYAIDQIAFTASARFVTKDIYTGLGLAFKEPYLNAGFAFGCDLKLWYTRVLVQESPSRLYQYWDRGYMAYAGVFKDFTLKENPFGSNFLLSVSLLGGYSFGHTLKGTMAERQEKFNVVPSLAFKWNYRKFTTSLGAEYVKTQFMHNGPVWLRAGMSYTLFLDKVRTQIKPIKWY